MSQKQRKLYTQDDLDKAVAKAKDSAFQQRDDAMNEVEERRKRIEKNGKYLAKLVLDIMRAAHIARGKVLLTTLTNNGSQKSIVFDPVYDIECEVAYNILKKELDENRLLFGATSELSLAK